MEVRAAFCRTISNFDVVDPDDPKGGLGRKPVDPGIGFLWLSSLTVSGPGLVRARPLLDTDCQVPRPGLGQKGFC